MVGGNKSKEVKKDKVKSPRANFTLGEYLYWEALYGDKLHKKKGSLKRLDFLDSSDEDLK